MNGTKLKIQDGHWPPYDLKIVKAAVTHTHYLLLLLLNANTNEAVMLTIANKIMVFQLEHSLVGHTIIPSSKLKLSVRFLLLCLYISYFFSQEHFSWHVVVREVNPSREAVELGLNAFIIEHRASILLKREWRLLIDTHVFTNVISKSGGKNPLRNGAAMGGGSGMSLRTGAGCGGGGSNSGGGGGGCLERWEPKRSPSERCLSLILLEMTLGPEVFRGEGCGEEGFGTGCRKNRDNVNLI